MHQAMGNGLKEQSASAVCGALGKRLDLRQDGSAQLIHQIHECGFLRNIAGIEYFICLGIEWRAAFDQVLQVFHRFVIVGSQARIASGLSALDIFLRGRLQPDRIAV